MWELSLLVFFVLFASAICSTTEAAVLSLPFLRARMLVEEGRHGSKSLLFIKENIHITIAVIIMLNNAVNISGAFFVGQKVTSLFGVAWLGWASAAMTIGIIVFSEIFPKAVGERYKIP